MPQGSMLGSLYTIQDGTAEHIDSGERNNLPYLCHKAQWFEGCTQFEIELSDD